MKLITENGNKIGRICESKDESGEKSLFIEGIFAQAEKTNRNGRVYPKKVLENAIETYIEDYVKTNRALGEVKHPTCSTPDPERACILVKNLHWEDNDVYGKAKVLSTPMGQLIGNLIKDGVQLGVSTRGVGSLSEKRGISVVESDYTITAIDVVTNPSGIDCWVHGVNESIQSISEESIDRWTNGILNDAEFYYENGILKECTIDEYQKRIKKGTLRDIKFAFLDFNKRIKL